MTEIRFYHLQTQPLETALPLILQKALDGGHKIVVRAKDSKQVELLNDKLWLFRPDSFLPHGSEKDGNPELQPIWLTDKDENPNQADVLILTGQSDAQDIDGFKLCCEVFDGHDEEALTHARAKWKSYKDTEYDLTYWQQNNNGGWDKKA